MARKKIFSWVILVNSRRTLETSLIWQRFILNRTTDPKQRERAEKAIAKLEEELAHAKQ